MEAEKLKPAIEAILFACGTPAELTKIAQALEIKEEKAEEVKAEENAAETTAE